MREPLSDGLGYEPINLVAACLLMKAPWWAKVPEEVKREIRTKKVEMRVFVEMTREAPERVRDRIGERLHGGTVIGYSRRRAVESAGGRRREREGHRPERIEHRWQLWWVMFDNGVVQEISTKTLNEWQREGAAEWRERHWPREGDKCVFTTTAG